MRPPRILAVIVNFNKKGMLQDMLRSLLASGPKVYDVVVVDNASSDGSAAMVREQFPWVTLLENPVNLGGTGGFNTGMKYGLNHPARYEFFWLLDNDVHVHAGALQALLSVMESRERAAVVGSAVVLMEDEQFVQEVGARVDRRTGALHKVGTGALSALQRPAVHRVDYVSACSCLARVEAIRQVGIWDPSYFVWWDDIDWGMRLQDHGWEVLATTEAVVRHEGFENRRARAAAFTIYLAYRNGFHFFRQNFPLHQKLTIFFTKFRLALATMENYRVNGQQREIDALRLAMTDFFAGRQGPPPAHLLQRDEAGPPPAAPLPQGLKRIGLLARDNAPFLHKMHAELSARFPEARVETLVISPHPEMLREAFPHRVVVGMESFLQRLLLAATLPGKYDALAAPSYQQSYFFQKCMAVNLRLRDDGGIEVQRRSGARVLGIALRRLLVPVHAAVLAVRAALLPRVPVAYTDFTPAPDVVLTPAREEAPAGGRP